jgi:hypothetical protein
MCRKDRTSSYFIFSGQFYEQTDVMIMGLPLPPVIASFFMEDFEEVVIDWSIHKPLCWFHYMDETFIIQPHGSDKLKVFLDHLNRVHQNIHFTMEMERGDHLPFMGIHIVTPEA